MNFGVAFGGDLEWVKRACLSCHRNGSGRLRRGGRILVGRLPRLRILGSPTQGKMRLDFPIPFGSAIPTVCKGTLPTVCITLGRL